MTPEHIGLLMRLSDDLASIKSDLGKLSDGFAAEDLAAVKKDLKYLADAVTDILATVCDIRDDVSALKLQLPAGLDSEGRFKVALEDPEKRTK